MSRWPQAYLDDSNLIHDSESFPYMSQRGSSLNPSCSHPGIQSLWQASVVGLHISMYAWNQDWRNQQLGVIAQFKVKAPCTTGHQEKEMLSAVQPLSISSHPILRRKMFLENPAFLWPGKNVSWSLETEEIVSWKLQSSHSYITEGRRKSRVFENQRGSW